MKSTSSCIREFVRVGLALAIVSIVSMGSASETVAQRSAAALYQDAKAAEEKLQRSKAMLGKKSAWLKVAKSYRQVVIDYPQSGYCDDALYYEAEIYLEVHSRFKDAASLRRALDTYKLLADGYPSSKWAKKARLNRGKIYADKLFNRGNARNELRKVTARWPNTSEGAEARRLIANLDPPKRAATPERTPSGLVGVRNIRHWSDSNREYTRVVIDLDKDVKYRQGRLHNPDRIYFDLIGTRVTRALAAKTFPINGDFLRQIRVGQNQPETVRVVLDFKNVSDYNVFWLPEPFRLVVDISGRPPTLEAPTPPTVLVAEAGTPAVTAPPEAPESAPAAEPTSTAKLNIAPAPRKDGYTIYQQLGLQPRRVLIDAGHGGHDPGTMSKSGLKEKDLVLDISHRVAKLLERDAFEVMMTRDKDVFIPLEERTAIANSKGVDLFVSIHVNASRSSKPRGTETYFLNLATTPAAAEVAARENASSARRVSELDNLLQKVINNGKITESRELATHVQDSMASTLYTSKKDRRYRCVK